MRAVSFLLAAVGFLACVGAVSGANLDRIWERIISPDPGVRAEARQRVLNQRLGLTNGLLDVVRDPAARAQNPDAVILAIKLLGEMRASEAVEPLVDMITFTDPRQRKSGPLFGITRAPIGVNAFPVVPALIEIGNPALSPVVRHAQFSSKSSSALGAELLSAGAVVSGILGRRLAIVYLQDELAAEKDPERQRRLKVMTQVADRGF